MEPKVRQKFLWNTTAELELLQTLCQTDFWTFFLTAFGAGANPKGQRWIDREVHYPLALWLQKHADEWLHRRHIGMGEQKYLAVLIHREVGKTTAVVQAFQLWLHLRDPDISTFTGSEKHELASQSLAAMKAVLDGSDPYALFTKLYGNWTGGRLWAAKAATHAGRKNIARRDPSFGTFAVETSIVGAHPDAIFYDDPISYERLESDANWLGAVNSQVTSLIPVIQSDGLIVWTGTRYDLEDHFGTAFAEEGVASLEGIPTDAVPKPEPGGQWHVYFMAGRDQQGVPTTPKVWPEARLARYAKRHAVRYAAQIMNDPESSEHNPITKERIEQCWIDRDQVPMSALRFAICTDLALSDGEKIVGKDETVFIVHGYPRNGSGDVYVMESHGSPLWKYEEFAARLLACVQRYRRDGKTVFAITGEKARAGLKDVMRSSLRNRFALVNEPMPNYIEYERGNTKKYERLHAATTFWNDDHVRVVRGGYGNERLMEQMARVGQYAFNQNIKIDYVDAHSDAFQPELYQTVRRMQAPDPYLPGAKAYHMAGLDDDMFDDSEERQWMDSVPRRPLR